MLREMPPVPEPAPEEPAPPEDDIMAARWEVEAELKAGEDIMDIKGALASLEFLDDLGKVFLLTIFFGGVFLPPNT